jgi:putative ABC transport system permease protein
MLQSFLILLRRLTKEKVFYFIVLTNLAVGYATFGILSQYISGEFSWDKQNTNYDRIYRVQLFMDQKENSITHTWSVTAALSRKDLVDLPEIEKIVLMHDVGDNNKNGVFLSIDKKNQLLTRYGYYSDQTVFDTFTFSFLEGDQQQALVRPYSIVLSKELADKLFHGEKAVGRQVYGENKVVFTVTGVYDNLPVKTTWRPAFLLPMSCFTPMTGWKDFETNYWAYSFYTYVLLKPNANPSLVDNKIHSALRDFRKEHYPYLRPMADLHLNPYFQNGYSIALVLVSFLAALILILSSINFVNLYTANSATRLREIGIKKTVGFSKRRLWCQFIFESEALAVAACLIGLMLAQMIVPSLNNMIGKEFFSNIFSNLSLLLTIFLVTLVTGFLSGLYPAYVISAYNPVAALRQKFVNNESGGFSLKNALVTLQFSISVFMLIVGFIFYRQTEYMMNREMGFNSEELLFANIVTSREGSIESLKQKLLQHSEIKNVCVSDYIPFILPGGSDLTWEGGYPDQRVFVRLSNISYDFVPTFGLQIVKGRNFSRDFPADNDKCLINETAARIFGWKEPVGMHMKVHKNDCEVIGVIKDYIVSSVYMPTEPHLYRLVQDAILSDAVYSVSFEKGHEKKAMQIVKDEFGEFFPEDAFDFRNIQTLIQNEEAIKAWKVFRRLVGLSAMLTIVISTIGLFGLILFYTQRKMKEVGIRKVLGFSTGSLYLTLSTGFLKLIFISVVLAWPAGYYVYKIMPAGANRYPIQVWEFLAATFIILLVAMCTISYQIIRALKVKPVDILKDE